ncbi:MAG: diguanylate cyclase [Lachnospiraceae bacterium]|nr:diguanylate cyclase [Lachnospiraceae bacterium]
MVQKTYLFSTIEQLHPILNTITSSTEYQEASGILIQVFNPRVDLDESKLISDINEKCNKACITGMTASNIAEASYDISEKPVQLSISYFFKTKLLYLEYDLKETTTFVAGRKVNEILEHTENACAMQIIYTSNSSNILSFTGEFSHHGIPVFGAKAGRSIRALNTAHVYGSHCYENALIAVIFCSQDLSVYLDHNLGWQEIGVEMVATKVNGNRILSEVDGRPAVEIYEKYLNVKPDSYFMQNVCEFPLVCRRNNIPTTRVPFSYDEEGAIHFSAEIRPGEHFRLSYADANKLKQLSAESVQDLNEFRPEAIYIIECGNRMRFLKDDYRKELDNYKTVVPQLSFTTGNEEIFVTPEGYGGDLNSALITVGLKETGHTNWIIPYREIKKDPAETDSFANQKIRGEIPFVDRILTFLASTSKELDELNKELGRIAYTDQLTQIYNRWELENKIKEALSLKKANKDHSVALLFMDIDHFKKVNDTYGHDAGDMVLRGTVNLIREELKNECAFGRWGGEEFLCLLRSSKEEALDFAEHIRTLIEETCFVNVKHITISIGVTMVKEDDTVESFIKRADQGLYDAKEGGRNRVIFRP